MKDDQEMTPGLTCLYLAAIIILIASIACAHTGASKVCDDIGYLSTSCLDVDVLPFDLKDKDVALKAAGATKNYTKQGDVSIKIITEEKKKSDDGVSVTTYFSEE